VLFRTPNGLRLTCGRLARQTQTYDSLPAATAPVAAWCSAFRAPVSVQPRVRLRQELRLGEAVSANSGPDEQ
jgi:hypothetical protein